MGHLGPPLTSALTPTPPQPAFALRLPQLAQMVRACCILSQISPKLSAVLTLNPSTYLSPCLPGPQPVPLVLAAIPGGRGGREGGRRWLCLPPLPPPGCGGGKMNQVAGSQPVVLPCWVVHGPAGGRLSIQSQPCHLLAISPLLNHLCKDGIMDPLYR